MRRQAVGVPAASWVLFACTGDPGGRVEPDGPGRSPSSTAVPTIGASPGPTSSTEAHFAVRVDLGRVSAKSEVKGRGLVFGAWGKAPGRFGMSRDSQVGPSSST